MVGLSFYNRKNRCFFVALHQDTRFYQLYIFTKPTIR